MAVPWSDVTMYDSMGEPLLGGSIHSSTTRESSTDLMVGFWGVSGLATTVTTMRALDLRA